MYDNYNNNMSEELVMSSTYNMRHGDGVVAIVMYSSTLLLDTRQANNSGAACSFVRIMPRDHASVGSHIIALLSGSTTPQESSPSLYPHHHQ